MLELTTEETKPDRFTRHKIIADGQPMSFDSVLESWTTNESFRTFFAKALSESSFEGYRWETPPLTDETVSQEFEFVLVNSPGFCKRKTNPVPFRKKFESAAGKEVITFANLSGDATMIVPTPQAEDAAYGHLAAFIRGAPESQTNNLWKVVGETVRSKIGQVPIWLSTAGGGVAWLHVRIDSSPKYYSYTPYRQSPARS